MAHNPTQSQALRQVFEGHLIPAGPLRGGATLGIVTSPKSQIQYFAKPASRSLLHQSKGGQYVLSAGNHQEWTVISDPQLRPLWQSCCFRL